MVEQQSSKLPVRVRFLPPLKIVNNTSNSTKLTRPVLKLSINTSSPKSPFVYKNAKPVTNVSGLFTKRKPVWGFTYKKNKQNFFLLKNLEYSTSIIFNHWISNSPFLPFFLLFWKSTYSLFSPSRLNKTTFNWNSYVRAPFTCSITPNTLISRNIYTDSKLQRTSNNFLIFLTYKMAMLKSKTLLSHTKGSVRVSKILNRIKSNSRLNFLSTRLFQSVHFRYSIQRFARKSRLGATVPRFYTFSLNTRQDTYNPYTPLSGSFLSIPETKYLTPSYFLISSSNQFLKTKSWSNTHLGATRLENAKFLSFKSSKLRRLHYTSKLFKKLKLVIFDFSVNFLRDDPKTNHPLISKNVHTTSFSRNLATLNRLTYRFVKRYRKAPRLSIQLLKIGRKIHVTKRCEFSLRFLTILQNELLRIGMYASEHLILRRLNKLICLKLLKHLPNQRKFIFSRFKKKVKKLHFKTSTTVLKRSKLNYRFLLARSESNLLKQISKSLKQTRLLPAKKKFKKKFLKRRTLLVWRRSFLKIKRNMKKSSSRFNDYEQNLTERFTRSFFRDRKFFPIMGSKKRSKRNVKTLKMRPIEANFYKKSWYFSKQLRSLSLVAQLKLRSRKRKPLLKKITSKSKMMGYRRFRKLRENQNLFLLHKTYRFKRVLLRPSIVLGKQNLRSSLLARFRDRSRFHARGSAAFEKSLLPLFAAWGRLNYDYTLWVKKMTKLPRRKKRRRRNTNKKILLLRSYALRLRSSFLRLVLLKPRKFKLIKTNKAIHRLLSESNTDRSYRKRLLSNLLNSSTTLRLMQTRYVPTFKTSRKKTLLKTHSLYKSFFRTSGTLKIRRKRAFRRFLKKNILKSIILKSSKNSLLFRLRKKLRRKRSKIFPLKVSNSSYFHTHSTRNWVKKLTNPRLNSLISYVNHINLSSSSYVLTNTPSSVIPKTLTRNSLIQLKTNRNDTFYQKLFSSKKLTGDVFFFSRLTSNPLILKYMIFKTTSLVREKTPFVTSLRSTLLTQLLKDSQVFSFGDRRILNKFTNIQPTLNLKVAFKRRVIYNLIQKTFMVNIVLLKYKMLIEAMEHFSGRKIYLKLSPSLEKSLTFEDSAQCRIWESRIYGFRRMLGPRIFVVEALRLVCLSLRLKDPTFLANWIRGMLKRLSFWKHRLIFRYLRYLIRYLFMNYFPQLGFRGIKVQLKGKISVAGNARTRTLFFSYGETSQSTFDHKVAYDLSFVETFTGVMGFKLWFFY